MIDVPNGMFRIKCNVEICGNGFRYFLLYRRADFFGPANNFGVLTENHVAISNIIIWSLTLYFLWCVLGRCRSGCPGFILVVLLVEVQDKVVLFSAEWG